MVPEIAQPVYCPSSDIVRVSNHEYHEHQLDESVNERRPARNFHQNLSFIPRLESNLVKLVRNRNEYSFFFHYISNFRHNQQLIN